jgi:hypothetical protein
MPVGGVVLDAILPVIDVEFFFDSPPAGVAKDRFGFSFAVVQKHAQKSMKFAQYIIIPSKVRDLLHCSLSILMGALQRGQVDSIISQSFEHCWW